MLKIKIVSFGKKSIFRTWFCFLCADVITTLLCGCAAAYNARTIESPDWKYSATCYIRGAFGHSYGSETKKLVRVSIYELKPGARKFEEKEEQDAVATGTWVSRHGDDQRSKLLFAKEYWVKGSFLEWESSWGPQDELSIVFYDYGPKVPFAKEDAPKHIVTTMKYKFDINTGLYGE